MITFQHVVCYHCGKVIKISLDKDSLEKLKSSYMRMESTQSEFNMSFCKDCDSDELTNSV